jgi:nucleotide-binding universal stress UspA family protein
MKKIIAAFDGLKYAESTRDYAINITKQTNAHLVAAFLDDSLHTSYKVYDILVADNNSAEKLKVLEQKDLATRKKASINFEQFCQHAKLEFTVHHDKNIAIQELIHESIYADLIIVNALETLTHYSEKAPTRFVREFLIDTQCPVLIVPQKYKPIEKIILLYDGEPSSMHAIKTFSYLLPQLKHLDTEVIVAKSNNATLHLPDNKLMKEFMKRHFPNAKYTILKGYAELEIITHLQQEKANTLVVLGAYRRGAVSRWFRESMADTLMRNLKLPLFIAHNK